MMLADIGKPMERQKHAKENWLVVRRNNSTTLPRGDPRDRNSGCPGTMSSHGALFGRGPKSSRPARRRDVQRGGPSSEEGRPAASRQRHNNRGDSPFFPRPLQPILFEIYPYSSGYYKIVWVFLVHPPLGQYYGE